MEIVILLSLSVFATPASAQEDAQGRWYGSSSADMTILMYGQPDSDDNQLIFHCEDGTPDLRIWIFRDPIKTEGGEPVNVNMTAGGVSVDLVGQGVIEQNYGMLEIDIETPLDDKMRHLLTAGEALSITVEGKTETFNMGDARSWGWSLVAACGSKSAAGNLDVTVVNGASLPLESLAASEAGSTDHNTDTFGYEALAPGGKRTYIILGGRDICTFDFWVRFQEKDDDCCSDLAYSGTQNLCENNEFTVRDLPVEKAVAQPASETDPWVGEWEGDGLSATIRRGTAKPEFLVIELVAGQQEPSCAGAVTLYGEPKGNRVVGESYDPSDKAAPVCRVEFSLDPTNGLKTEAAGPCTYYHGAACGFDGQMKGVK